MPEKTFEQSYLHSSADIIDPSADRLWELFHDNSKSGQYQSFMSNEQILSHMERLSLSFNYQNYPLVTLPPGDVPLDKTASETMLGRVSARALKPTPIPLKQLAALLFYAYGVTRPDPGAEFPRPFRATPSGGALYPLELYVCVSSVESLEQGLYHYNASEHHLRRLISGDLTTRLSQLLVQSELAAQASCFIFITAVFERSIFKYGNRGYRFILLESGHVAQNINLTAAALDLGSLNLGGYFDRKADDLLGVDGVTHSTLYMVAVGGDSSPRN